jgi:hypothetical protein
MACALIDLSGVADSALVCEVERLCKSDRALSAVLILHLGEVLARKLYLELGFSSMFDYCRAGLGMSEAEAYLRIQAAKVGREFPLVLERLGEGALHLTAIKLLAPHLTEENCAQLLERVRGLSKRKIEEIVAELAPKPDVPARVRKLPGARDCSATASEVAQGGNAELFATASTAAWAASAPHEASTFAQGAPLLAPAFVPPPAASVAVRPPLAARAVPLSPGRFKLEATLDQEEYDALEQLRDLLRHQIPSGDIARVVGRALKAHCKNELNRRFAQSHRTHRAPRESEAERDGRVAAVSGAYRATALAEHSPAQRGANARDQRNANARDQRNANARDQRNANARDQRNANARDERNANARDERNANARDERNANAAPTERSNAPDERTANAPDERTANARNERNANARNERGANARNERGANARDANARDERNANARDARNANARNERSANARDERNASAPDENSPNGVAPTLPASAGARRDTSAHSTGSRYVPRAVLREVFARDSGQCTFVGADGRRCASRGFLEVHHHFTAFARGGAATVENLRLACRAHNLLIAEHDYGRDFVREKVLVSSAR